MPPTILQYFPGAATLTFSILYKPPFRSSPLSLSRLSTLIPYSLRILKQQKKTFTNSYCQSNPPTWCYAWDIYFEDESNKNWRRIWCEVWGKERNQRWLCQQGFPLPLLCLSLSAALALSLTNTQVHSHMFTQRPCLLSCFLFCFLQYQLTINWNTKHFTPLLDICLLLPEYKLYAGKDF